MPAALPCVEVADAPPTEAYLKDPTGISLVGPALNLLKESKGILQIYYGLQTEEDKHVYVYNVWETLKNHRDLQEDAELYPVLGAHCSAFMAERSRMVHIYPTTEPYAALGAPATELAYITVKQGKSKEEVVKIGQALMDKMNSLDHSWGCVSAVWGQTEEDPNTIAFIIGWTSVDAHWNTVKTDADAIRLLTELREIADITLTHQNLKDYAKVSA